MRLVKIQGQPMDLGETHFINAVVTYACDECGAQRTEASKGIVGIDSLNQSIACQNANCSAPWSLIKIFGALVKGEI